MNLLLLLSALLSALTGVGGGVRGGQAVQAVAERQAMAETAIAVARARTNRPAAALPTLTAQAVPVALAMFPVHPATPLYASRRRE